MRFKLGNSNLRYIYDTPHLNTICVISYFDIFTFFRVLFILQHICYYFNQPTPYLCTLHVVYSVLFVIHLPFARPVKPRIFTVIVWFYRILRQQYRITLRLRDQHTHM